MKFYVNQHGRVVEGFGKYTGFTFLFETKDANVKVTRSAYHSRNECRCGEFDLEDKILFNGSMQGHTAKGIICSAELGDILTEKELLLVEAVLAWVINQAHIDANCSSPSIGWDF